MLHITVKLNETWNKLINSDWYYSVTDAVTHRCVVIPMAIEGSK